MEILSIKSNLSQKMEKKVRIMVGKEVLQIIGKFPKDSGSAKLFSDPDQRSTP